MQKSAFTLIELIFVIVIIGVLSAVAIPKFSGLSANSKVAAELATASTIQSSIDDVHSDWIISEGSFTWGNGKNNSNVNANGYPNQLGDCPPSFNWILKSSSTVDPKWKCTNNNNGTFTYRGPASKTNSGVSKSSDVPGKPDNNDYWEYNTTAGTFSLIDN
jgi:prepilin-type N-terminal cleavage/methylation domain-containing protein